MIVSYAIDWDSLYESWFVQKAEDGLNADPLNELRFRMRSLRKGIERNGIVFVDRGELSLRGIYRFMHGLDELIRTFSSNDAREVQLVAVCTRLKDELKVFNRWCQAAENRILLKMPLGRDERPYATLLEAANQYLKSTRLNRKKYAYPAVALSEDGAIASCDYGLRKRGLEEYESCSEELCRAAWSDGKSFVAGKKNDFEQVFAALSVAAGVDGRIGIYDPYWSTNMLRESPAMDWVSSTRLLLEILVPNKFLETITFCSADVMTNYRQYHFESFVDLIKKACALSQRKEKLKVRIELRDDSEKKNGRKVFHNRYIQTGRFLLQVPNGLDVTDQAGVVRNFDLEFTPRNNIGFLAIAKNCSGSSFTGEDIVDFVHDHREWVEAADDDAAACFIFTEGRLCLPQDDF